MPVTTFTEEEIQTFVREIKRQLIPELIQEMKQKQLPPLLTRKQFMELADISSTKCNELFNRQGFPVTRELGNPRVITSQFFDWLASTSNANEVNMPYPYRAI